MAPLAVAGVGVELEERIPVRFRDGRAGDPLDRDAAAQGLAALLAHRLALARGELAEEIVELRVALVVPVELLIGALQEALRPQRRPLVLGQEGEVQRGDAEALRDLDRRGREQPLALVRIRAPARPAGGGRARA